MNALLHCEDLTQAKRHDVAIIVPMLNEASELRQLRKTLDTLTPQPAEILLVDGHSSDNSVSLARQLGFKVLQAKKRGRAAQINAGVNAVTSPLICILHADNRLATDSIDLIQETLLDPKTSLGGFTAILANGDKIRWFTSFHNWIKTWYAPLFFHPIGFLKGGRLLFGDHAMFFRRKDFLEVEGCDESLRVMEDADLCIRLAPLGRIRLLKRTTYTSDRRIEVWGPLKANLLFIFIGMMWGFGLKHRFSHLYTDIRTNKRTTNFTQEPKPQISKQAL